MSRHRSAILRRLRGLAAVCDHATTLDNVGFSASTAARGHEMANLPDRLWSDDVDASGAALVLRHRKQVVAQGEVAADDMREIEAEFTDAPEGEIPDRWIAFDPDASRFVVSTPDARLRKRLKVCDGASQPAGRGKVWFVPLAKGHFFAGDVVEGYDADEATRAAIGSAVASGDPDDMILFVDRSVDFREGRFSFRFPYDPDLVDRMKDNGGRFEPETKTWGFHDGVRVRGLLDRIEADGGFLLTSRAAGRRLEPAPAVEPPGNGRSGGRDRGPPRFAVVRVAKGVAFSMTPYVEDWKEAAKSLPADKRKWNPEMRSWIVAAEPDVLRSLQDRLLLCAPAPQAEDMALIDVMVDEMEAAPVTARRR